MKKALLSMERTRRSSEVMLWTKSRAKVDEASTPAREMIVKVCMDITR
jgi:hypothetical protein